MKKLIVIVSGLLVLITLNANAQKGKELIFGVGGAFTNVWIINQNFYSEPEMDYALKTGYAFNLTLGYEFTEKIGIMTELQYSAQGQKYSDSQSWDTHTFDQVERDINLTYFNVPVFFRYRFGSGNTRFRFMVGPQFGFLMDAKQDYLRDGKRQKTWVNDQDGTPFDVTDPNIKDRIENFDIGIAADIGADISLSDQFFINAGLRFNYGFKDVNAEPYRLDKHAKDASKPIPPYEPSNNIWGGIYVSINYKIDVEGYSQRSF